MKKFEYTFRMNGMSISDMDAMGKEGWELVSILPPSTTGNSMYIHYFKREIEKPITFATLGGQYVATYTSPFVSSLPCNTDLAAIKVEAANDKT